MASQITATLPTLNFPREVDYPTQEDWAAFSAAAEENFGILGGGWSTQMQLWKTQANAMSTEFNTNATIAQGLANYQGDWTSQGYTLGQTVSIGEVYYICKLTHATGQNPTDSESLYWILAIGNWNLKVNTNMSGYTSKSTPVDADLIPLSDSVSSFGIKKLSWANLKANLKTYFDTLYVSLSGVQTIDGIKTFTSKILSSNLSYKDTPVTITSWSYSTTTITLTVASHTFVVGDYIEVAGLTATTYPANGIHLVTSVTSTTIVFTLGATPTGTTGVSSATVKGYATLNGKVLSLSNQNIDVSGSRLIFSTYYNTSGKTKTVWVSCLTTGGGTITALVDGVTFQGTTATNSFYAFITFDVRNGGSYNVSLATPGTKIWIESI